jgi:hypothetical protein
LVETSVSDKEVLPLTERLGSATLKSGNFNSPYIARWAAFNAAGPFGGAGKLSGAIIFVRAGNK